MSKGAPVGVRLASRWLQLSSTSMFSRRTEEGNVVFGLALGVKALRVWQTAKGRDSGKHGVGLELDVFSGRSTSPPMRGLPTWVPPSPGSVLYQSDWWGPEMEL